MTNNTNSQIKVPSPEWHRRHFLLSQSEIDNPQQVYQAFFDTYTTEEVRTGLWNWFHSACQYECAEPANLLHLYWHCEKLIEASRLVYERSDWQRSDKDSMIRSMEQYFGIFTHELNSQLAGIKQCCECLQDGNGTSKNNADFYLQSIRAITNNALHVLDNFLATIKFHAGKLDIQLNKEMFCFGAWVRTAVQPFETDFAGQGKTIYLNVEPLLQNAVISGDKVKIASILHNLLTNALKFAYPDTTIVIKCFLQGTELVMLVINQCDGIPSEKIKSLFKPYQRFDEGSTGTGLGLYICRVFVEAMGGRIDVQSDPGAVTIFTVRIPGCISNSQ